MGGWREGVRGLGTGLLGDGGMEDGMGHRGFCIGFGVVVCDVM